jgi:homoserine O-acetyltransferase
MRRVFCFSLIAKRRISVFLYIYGKERVWMLLDNSRTMETTLTYFSGFKWKPYLKLARVADKKNPLHLSLGGILQEVVVAYETYGHLSANGDNVILLNHALTGDSHPASHNQHDEKGWWEPLVGSGRPLDTDKFYIICANVLGGCQGTTGPASPNPDTGLPYGMDFPEITLLDMVHVQKRLLELLGIDHVKLILGGSMGGMQALEWAVAYPDFMDRVMVIAAPGYASSQSIAYNKVGRQAIILDPDWLGGNYYGSSGPEKGLAIARAVGMITYQSEISMEGKFGRKRRNGCFEIENYLDYQGNSLARRFDANSYLYLLRAIDYYNLSGACESYEDALSQISAKVMIVGVSSDILYPPYQQKELVEAMLGSGVDAQYALIESPHGHDGFLIDFHLVRPIIHEFLPAT